MNHRILLAVTCVWACSGKDDEGDTGVSADADADADADSDADLTSAGVELVFDATVGGTPVSCATFPLGADRTATITDFRMYVSNIALVDTDGTEVPLLLEQDGKWQVQSTALLDYEDATGGCVSTGTSDTNHVVRGSVLLGDYVGVVFDLGVPFDLDHDVTLAPSPLNVPSLFWGWQVGYKFLGIDLQSDLPPPDNAWYVHLGSTGCVSDSAVDAPTVECANPNLPRIRLEGADPTVTPIELDLVRLLAGADLRADTPDTPPGCMSFAVDAAECTPVYEALGLDFATGDCVADCSGQTAFAFGG